MESGSRRGQSAIEYIIFLAAILIVVVIAQQIIQKNVVAPSVGQTNKSVTNVLNVSGTCDPGDPNALPIRYPSGQIRSCSPPVNGKQNRTCVSPGLWAPWTDCAVCPPAGCKFPWSGP